METLPNVITVTINGEQKQLLMSFNKLNRCNILVGDAQDLALVLMAPSLRMAIVQEMLSVKGAPVDLDEVNISHEDSLRLLDFVCQHLADFTMGAAKRAQKLAERVAPQFQAMEKEASNLMPTKNGRKG